MLDFPLTCIIGKNGCGKSALIDSICCCLGGNQKKLRVSKYSELISQTDNSNSDNCSVEIVFEETKTRKQTKISFFADIHGNVVYHSFAIIIVGLSITEKQYLGRNYVKQLAISLV